MEKIDLALKAETMPAKRQQQKPIIKSRGKKRANNNNNNKSKLIRKSFPSHEFSWQPQRIFHSLPRPLRFPRLVGLFSEWIGMNSINTRKHATNSLASVSKHSGAV